MQLSVLKLAYQVSGRRLFLCPEKNCFGICSGGFWCVRRVIFGEGESPFLSPRRLRAKYTLRTNLRFMLRGISPLQGANLRLRKFTVRKNRTVFIHAAGRTGAWMALLLTATFRGKYAALPVGLHRTKSLCGCQKATDVECPNTGISSQPAVL